LEKVYELYESEKKGTKEFQDNFIRDSRAHAEGLLNSIRVQSEKRVKEIETKEQEVKKIIEKLDNIRNNMEEILRKERSDEECGLLLKQRQKVFFYFIFFIFIFVS
jgi:glucosamine 6-phosphate synthetase-like amidotransferase/phosphosugar isomerase protein